MRNTEALASETCARRPRRGRELIAPRPIGSAAEFAGQGADLRFAGVVTRENRFTMGNFCFGALEIAGQAKRNRGIALAGVANPP